VAKHFSQLEYLSIRSKDGSIAIFLGCKIAVVKATEGVSCFPNKQLPTFWEFPNQMGFISGSISSK
jgi:hypothetical protein